MFSYEILISDKCENLGLNKNKNNWCKFKNNYYKTTFINIFSINTNIFKLVFLIL